MSEDIIKQNLQEFFEILDKEEESSEGRVFHPTFISSCRTQDVIRLNEILNNLKNYINE